MTWPLLALASPLLILALSLSSLMLLRQIYAGVQFTYRFSQIPDNLQGRVNSVFRLIALGSTPVGLALEGACRREGIHSIKAYAYGRFEYEDCPGII